MPWRRALKSWNRSGRLSVALLLGSVIGFERQLRQKMAGLGTMAQMQEQVNTLQNITRSRQSTSRSLRPQQRLRCPRERSARDIDRFISLFAEDAIIILPDGREVSGAPAIREMELAVFAASPPTPTPVAIVAGEDSVAVEIEVRLPSGQLLKCANFFHLNKEGRIQRLSVYCKSG